MNTNEMCDYDFLSWAQGHFSEEEWDRLCDLLGSNYDGFGGEDSND